MKYRRLSLFLLTGLLCLIIRGGLSHLEPPATGNKAPTPREKSASPRPATVCNQASSPSAAPRAAPDCPYCPEVARIPGGEFWMGSARGWKDERPVHRLRVAEFSMGKYEVTQGQWRKVMGNNPSYFSACGDDCPVEQVSFLDVNAYIGKLNRRSGRQYRLPTEAEWVYACRGGGRNQNHCGEGTVNAFSWNRGNSGGKTHPVGGKTPNGLQLYDMSGNVWEWTCSKYSSAYIGNETECGKSGRRVVRGGSWINLSDRLRSAFRNRFSPAYRSATLGFRLAHD